MRRLTSAIIALSLVLLTQGAFAQTFGDAQNTRYNEAVSFFAQQNMVQGYRDGGIHPFDLVNRAEALKITVSAQERLRKVLANHTKHPPSLQLFPDVRVNEWYSAYVETAFEMGFIKGYSDGRFRPGQSVSLAEALVLLSRAEGWNVSSAGSSWYGPALDEAKKRNLLSNRELWRPEMAVSRGQLLDIVYRAHQVRTQGLIAFREPDLPAGVIASAPIAYQPVTQPGTTQPGNSPSPAAPAGGPGYTNVFTISIPALGISNMNVGHPTSTSQQGLLAPLKAGVGHLYGLPGGNSKILVFGHSSSFRWDISQWTQIFRTINKLKAGDQIFINYKGKQYTYVVTGQQQISPSDLSVFSGVGQELILYTCWPPDTIDKRLLVRAKPV